LWSGVFWFGAPRRPDNGGRRNVGGTFIIDLTPEAAPGQVDHFMKLAAAGAYDGTTFHRMV
jgi:cyclophilin family peptidyl-prolyl cis-trans isomerase